MRTKDVVDPQTGEVEEVEVRDPLEASSVEELYQGDPARAYEFPNDTPVAPPLGFVPQPTMVEHIQRMKLAERLAAELAEAETFEEADDFVVGDDYDPNSPYEEVFDPVFKGVGTYDPNFQSAVQEHVDGLKAQRAAEEAAKSSPPQVEPSAPPAPTPAPIPPSK